jgi:glycerate kinase
VKSAGLLSKQIGEIAPRLERNYIEMKPTILIAPACFKGSLSAKDAADVMRTFLLEHLSPEDTTLRLCPIADGGDDTLAVLQGANPEYKSHTLEVTGPLPGMSVQAQYLVNAAQKTVLIEAAQAHGLTLLPGGKPQNPMQATSYGVGELIRHALKAHQPETLVVSVGGSASTDGGLGALQALGVQLLDEAGQIIKSPIGGGDLARVQRVEWLSETAAFTWKRLMIATDVVNPLLGSEGAAKVFAPQKGANPQECEQLEAGLQHISQRMVEVDGSKSGDVLLASLPGVGAAGGLAYGLRCLPRSGIVSGSQWVAAQLNLPQQVAESQIILTGEGCLDATSLSGKATGHLLAMAGDKPVFIFCGQVRDGLTGWGQVSVYPMLQPNGDKDCSASLSSEDIAQAKQEAMANPKAALRRLLEVAWPKLESLLASV